MTLTAVILALPRVVESPVSALALGATGAALLLWLRPALRQTTMTGPWWWTLLSLAAITGAQAVSNTVSPDRVANAFWIGPLQYAAAVTAFCPMMAQLGAKRPQNRAWGFVVLSLWAIVALPALESLALQRETTMRVTDLRAWFLWGLIAVGVANMLPTRYWHCALAAGAAQACLLADHLPLMKTGVRENVSLLGLALGVAAIGGAAVVSRLRKSNSSWDLVWTDFRDLFGALWGLRIAERVNAVAEAQQWSFTLRWQGFRRRDNGGKSFAPSAQEREQLRRTMSNLLRRFVAPEWIASRLDESVD